LKNAFNNAPAFVLLDARKTCATIRIIRLVSASSVEITRKPSIGCRPLQLQYQVSVYLVTVA